MSLINELSAGPCLPRAPRLRAWNSVSFYNQQSLLLSLLLCLWKAQIPPRDAPPNHSPRIWFHHKNPSVFKFSRLRKSEKRLPRLPKTTKSIPKFIKRDFREKSVFAIPSMRKLRLEVPNVQISSQESIKR